MQKSWQMLCSSLAVKARAQLYTLIRNFFIERNVLEVETPLLSQNTVTDPFIDSLSVRHSEQQYYLQTSPEFAMKRVLACAVGSIFQICKAFRKEEYGAKHNSEFSLLEWYRVDFDLDDLMNEMAELLKYIASNSLFTTHNSSLLELDIQKISYQDLFIGYCDFDYTKVNKDFLKNFLIEKFDNRFNHLFDAQDSLQTYDKDDLLMMILSDYIEPKMPDNTIILLYDYPKSQCALARTEYSATAQIEVAKRFEVYWNGIELANGFYELSDSKEQLARFKSDISKRHRLNLDQVDYDQNLISALESGLPDCSGVALGLDRLLMLLLAKSDISEVLTFR